MRCAKVAVSRSSFGSHRVQDRLLSLLSHCVRSRAEIASFLGSLPAPLSCIRARHGPGRSLRSLFGPPKQASGPLLVPRRSALEILCEAPGSTDRGTSRNGSISLSRPSSVVPPSLSAVYSQHLTSARRGTVPRHFVPRYLCLFPASFLGAHDAPCRSLPFSEPVGWCSSSDPIMRCPPCSVKSANATERGLPTTAFAIAELTSRWQLTDKEYCVPHSMPLPPLSPGALGFQT